MHVDARHAATPEHTNGCKICAVDLASAAGAVAITGRWRLIWIGTELYQTVVALWCVVSESPARWFIF